MIIKVLKFLGALVYGAIMYFLLWLCFYFLTPYVMGLSLKGLFVYLGVAGGGVTVLLATAALWLEFPLIFLCRNCKAAKYAPIIFGVFNGFSAVRLPWILDMEYGVVQWIAGILFTITILVSFIGLMVIPFKLEEEEEYRNRYKYDD